MQNLNDRFAEARKAVAGALVSGIGVLGALTGNDPSALESTYAWAIGAAASAVAGIAVWFTRNKEPRA